MRFILIVILFLLSYFSYGQNSKKRTSYSKNYPIKVIYEHDSINNFRYNKPIAFFVNNNLLSNENIESIDKNEIKNINIEKTEFSINGKKYFGKVLIRMKQNHTSNYISLKELINKYLDLKETSILFQINEKIIHQNYKDYIIDENFILKIIVDKIKTSKIDTEISLIKILTKTKENIRNTNQIIIR